MPAPIRDLDAVLTQVSDRWDAQRTERTLSALHRKRRQRQRWARVSSAAGVACVLAAFAIWGWPRKPQLSASAEKPSAAVAPSPSSPLHMPLADGSDIWLHDAAAHVVVNEASATLSALELLSGRARFEVSHREQRVFRVRAGEVTVEVLGTAFELEREAARTRVVVLRGRVAVSWTGGRTELSAGEAGWFPRAPLVGDLDSDTPSPHSAKHVARKSGSAAAPTTWREPAEQGDFEHAYELLERAPQPVADNVEELLLAADTARLSGHPSVALPFLKRVIAQHARDSRAPLAAFTLGGVLMQQLGQPREAEAAYARARAMSLNASLAEDALARQVEAAHRAGDPAHARALANEYLSRYPNGRRVHAVQRFGGLAP